MSRTVRVKPAYPLTPGRRTVLEVEDKSIALFNIDGTLYAIDDSCPHHGASLWNGKLQGCIVQCPAHGLRFDLRDGTMQPGAMMRVATYKVTAIEDELEIEFETP
jgi:3-phenylpropionate/trans-cinnamate dioxygenase ferredoxin subunit